MNVFTPSQWYSSFRFRNSGPPLFPGFTAASTWMAVKGWPFSSIRRTLLEVDARGLKAGTDYVLLPDGDVAA
jgi:hypothetical protein